MNTDKPQIDIPQSDFEKFGQAIADLREAIYEHHPFFVLARKLLDLWVARLPA